MAKPEKYILASSNGQPHVKCVLTLLGDSIIEGDMALKLQKGQQVPFRANIYPDLPWKLQQIQDAGNHLLKAIGHSESRDKNFVFTHGQQVVSMLDNIVNELHRGRTSLALPKKKRLDELIYNQNVKCIKPPLPQEGALSFYVQQQKLVLVLYTLFTNQAQQLDVCGRHQVECSVPWLNEILVFFTIAMQQCQELKDKISLFAQYEAERKFKPTVTSSQS